MSDEVIEAVTAAAVDAALAVPGDLLDAGAEALVDAPEWSPTAESALVNASPAAHYQEHAQKIAQAWSRSPSLSGAAVAAAMKAASATAEAVHAKQQISMVWTGPATESIGLRSTRSVLNTMVANATESLVLVSFASYKVADLTASLAEAIAREVEVTLILETPNDPGAPLIIGPSHPFAPIRDSANFYQWPLEAREAFFAADARLHAKCVIADRSTALITSANLTSAGINDNIELGILIEAGPLPARLHQHLELLIEDGTLEKAEL